MGQKTEVKVFRRITADVETDLVTLERAIEILSDDERWKDVVEIGERDEMTLEDIQKECPCMHAELLRYRESAVKRFGKLLNEILAKGAERGLIPAEAKA